MTPTIETIRPGVQFTPEAAASFRRAEADLGRSIDVNSTYRSWATQLRMWNAWTAYIQGRGPHPGHSRAIHPSLSRHVDGLGLDSDDWTRPGFNEFMAERGWIRVAANDPTERHHYEYQAHRDRHRNRPATVTRPPATPIPTRPEDDMTEPKIIKREDPKYAPEWSLVHPDFQGPKGERGYIPTTDPNEARDWGRIWGQGGGNVSNAATLNRADYVSAQATAGRVYDAAQRAKGAAPK